MQDGTGVAKRPRTPQDIYQRLEGASPEERTALVLRLLDEAPNGRLELPARDGVGANLHGVDLSPEAVTVIYGRRLRMAPPTWWDRDFHCVRLVRANLQGANLFSANLSRAHLQYANLRDARLWMADLTGALLLGSDLTGASLMGATLRDASLVGARLVDAGLREGDLTRANLEYADLRGANAWGTDLSGAYLRDAGLQGVDLTHAGLKQVHVAGAVLGNTLLHEAQFAGAIGEEVDGDYGWARFGYQLLRRNFLALGDARAADWAYRRERLMLRMQARAQRQWGRLLTAHLADALRGLLQVVSGFASPLLGRPTASSSGGEEPAQHPAGHAQAEEGTVQQPESRP